MQKQRNLTLALMHFLRLLGNGVNKKVYKNFVEITKNVSRFQEDKQKELGDKYTDIDSSCRI